MADPKGIDVRGELSEDCKTVKLEHGGLMRHLLHRFAGKALVVTLRIHRKRRSDAQNRYMWGVMVTCTRSWMLEKDGYAPSREAVYTWLRHQLGDTPRVEYINAVDTDTGEIKRVEVITMTGKRFSQMTTKEFAAAVDTLRDFLLPQGCDIPEPKGSNMYDDYL